MQSQRLAQPQGRLVPFFHVSYERFLSALLMASNGGACLGGVCLPTFTEVLQGRFSALPFACNSFGLLVCAVVAFILHDTAKVLGFSLAQFLLTAWV